MRSLFRSPAVPPGLSMRKYGASGSASCHTTHSTIRHLAESTSRLLAANPLPPTPGCPSLPLLPVWMNVSSLSPWLLDFHRVQFSVSSSCFLFLNCCCPSFGCARRRSVSTYTFILAGSLGKLFNLCRILVSLSLRITLGCSRGP